MEKKEIKSLTGLRGVASLWIVLFHYFSKYELFYPFHTIINNGYVAVDIFFVLSAFLLTLVYNKKMTSINLKTTLHFYKKRINRIYPIYFFSLIFITITIGANFKTFIFNSLLIQCFFNIKYLVNIVYWSLSTEWICYLIFPFFLYAIHKFRINYKILLLLGIALRISLCFLPHLYFGEGPLTFLPIKFLDIPFGINSLIRTFSGYFIGVGIFYIVQNNFLKSKYINLYLLLFLLSILVPYGLLLTPIFIAFIIKFLYQSKDSLLSNFLSSRFVYFLGEISYSLYIVHTIFNYFSYKFSKIPFLNDTIIVILSILISVITYNLIEKRIKIFKVK